MLELPVTEFLTIYGQRASLKRSGCLSEKTKSGPLRCFLMTMNPGAGFIRHQSAADLEPQTFTTNGIDQVRIRTRRKPWIDEIVGS